MKALIDTHTFLWWNTNSPKLSDKAKEVIADGRNEIFFSAVSAWEITLKYGKGRLTLPEPPEIYIPKRILTSRFTTLTIQLSHTLQVHTLPEIHQDPFDRLLVVQSQMEQLPLLSIDSEISRYDITTIW